jgi:hypothetical protein
VSRYKRCSGCGAIAFAYEDLADFCTCDVQCCDKCGFPEGQCACPDLPAEFYTLTDPH